jgi:hypothetical protein
MKVETTTTIEEGDIMEVYVKELKRKA